MTTINEWQGIALFIVLVAGIRCTTTIDAIGSGGADSDIDVTTAVGGDGAGPVTHTATAAAGFFEVDAPCGSYFDWDSCEVTKLLVETPSIDTGSAELIGAWRRCNEAAPGPFPIGVNFLADGTVYRMYRKSNPIGVGTKNLVHCGDTPSDHGTWELAPRDADIYVLRISWNDGAAETFELKFYQEFLGFGLLHGITDSLETTERFARQAALIEGTIP
jgi:hypothetical protein